MAAVGGRCPQCDSEGSAGAPCSEPGCAKRATHLIPEQYWQAQQADLRARDDVNIGRLFGKFLAVRLLGQGAYGRVYLALETPGLGLRAAVKVLDGADLEDEAQRESTSLEALHHPHVVKLLASLELGPPPFFIMEYVGGAWTLRQELIQMGSCRRDRASLILNQLLDGLEAAHNADILHRDLKPENLLLTEPEGKPVWVTIIDFGLAKFVAHRTDTRQVAGTIAYMAPEQFERRDLGPWTDLYAVGIITYELLTGRRPFYDATDAEILRKKVDPRWDPASELPGGGPSLNRFLRQVLALDRARRPQSVREFRELLMTVLEEERGEEYITVDAGAKTLKRGEFPSREFPTDDGHPRKGDAGPPAGYETATTPPPEGYRLGRSAGSAASPAAGRAIATGLGLVVLALLLIWWAGSTPDTNPPRPAVAPTDASSKSDAVAAGTRFPSEPRLVVIPFQTEPGLEVDRDVFPLVSTMVANVLADDERILGRLEVVDPWRMVQEIPRRLELPPAPPAEPEEWDSNGVLAAEHRRKLVAASRSPDTLAKALEANLLLEGTLRREAGESVLQGALRPPGEGPRAEFTVTDVDVVRVAEKAAARVREALWGDTPGEPSRDRLDGLLLANAETAYALLELRPSTRKEKRTERLERLTLDDPESLGLLWSQYLEARGERAADLRRQLALRSKEHRDKELASFFASLRDGSFEDCDSAALGELAERYPLVLGSLAAAACWDRMHGARQAVKRAWDAEGQMSLRPLLMAFLEHRVDQMGSAEARGQREDMLKLEPNNPRGWSTLAVTYAELGKMAAARRALGVAHLMAGHDPAALWRTGYHGTLAHLVNLDVPGAGAWHKLMKSNASEKRKDHHHYALLVLHDQMAGRFAEALENAKRGMERLGVTGGGAFSYVAEIRFFLLTGDKPDGWAEAAASIVEDLRAHAAKQGDMEALYSYAAEMDDLLLKILTGATGIEAAMQEMKRLADRIRRYGQAGKTERVGHESFLWAYSGAEESPSACQELVRDNNSLKEVGACRIPYAKLLAEEGKRVEAIIQLETGLRELVRLRVGGLSLIPGAMLELARLNDREGRKAEASRWYQRLVDHYESAERRMDEVTEAQTWLAANGAGDQPPDSPKP